MIAFLAWVSPLDIARLDRQSFIVVRAAKGALLMLAACLKIASPSWVLWVHKGLRWVGLVPQNSQAFIGRRAAERGLQVLAWCPHSLAPT